VCALKQGEDKGEKGVRRVKGKGKGASRVKERGNRVLNRIISI
jgi:hypothetical protein